MATSGAQEIKKQEALVSFSIISYKTRLRVLYTGLISNPNKTRKNLKFLKKNRKSKFHI